MENLDRTFFTAKACNSSFFLPLNFCLQSERWNYCSKMDDECNVSAVSVCSFEVFFSLFRAACTHFCQPCPIKVPKASICKLGRTLSLNLLTFHFERPSRSNHIYQFVLISLSSRFYLLLLPLLHPIENMNYLF